MSKSVTDNAKLAEATEMRKAGFKSKLDQHPEVRSDFVDLLDTGKTFKVIHEMLVKKHGKKVPSAQALRNWKKNNKQKTVIVTDTRMADYLEIAKDIDAVKITHELVGNLQKRYVQLQKQGVKAQTLVRHESVLGKQLETLHKMQVQLGVFNKIYGGDSPDDKRGVTSGVVDEDNMPEMLALGSEGIKKIVARSKRMEKLNAKYSTPK